MKLLLCICVSALICTLIEGQTTAVGITISNGAGDSVSTGTLNGQLDDDITIVCSYTGSPDFDEIYTLYYRPASTDQYVQFGTRTAILHPWSEEPDRYTKAQDLQARPFTVTYSISRLMMKDSGEYQCRVVMVSNTQMDVTTPKSASISVQANVESVMLSGKETLEGIATYRVQDENREQTITCIAYNGSLPEMKIFIDTREIGILTITSMDNVHTGVINYDFMAVNDHGKEIRCEATVPGFDQAKRIDSATIALEYKPLIDCAQDEMEAEKDTTVVIECTISGRPPINVNKVTWVRLDNGDDIGAAEVKENLGLTSTYDVNAEPDEATLTIKSVSKLPVSYTLQAENSVGAAEPKTVKILEKKNLGPVQDGDPSSSTQHKSSLAAVTLITFALARLGF